MLNKNQSKSHGFKTLNNFKLFSNWLNLSINKFNPGPVHMYIANLFSAIIYANCSIALLFFKVELYVHWSRYILFLLSEALVQINDLSFEGRLLQPASSPQNFYNHTFLQWGLYGFLDGRKAGGTYVAAAILCWWKILLPPLAIILRRKQSFRTNEQIYFYLFSLSSSSSSTTSAKDRHQLLLVLPSNRRTRSISSLLLLLSQFNSFLKSLKLDSQGL